MRPMTMRLLVILVGILISLTPAPAAAQDWSAVWRDPEVVNYPLTMEKLRTLLAVQRDMTALAAREPDVPAKVDAEMKAMQKDRTAKRTVADAAGLLDKHASMRNIFAKHGITAREWLAISGAMSTVAIYLVLEERQSSAGSPASSLNATQKANLELLKKNRAEWKKIEEEFRRLAAESAATTKP
jgi:hypothetical protein